MVVSVRRNFPSVIGATRAAARKPPDDLVEVPGGNTRPNGLKRRLNLILELLFGHRYPPPSSSVTPTPMTFATPLTTAINDVCCSHGAARARCSSASDARGRAASLVLLRCVPHSGQTAASDGASC